MKEIPVHISLFGQFEISYAHESLHELGGAKGTELLIYLFLHHSRAHTREALATLLWQEGYTSKRAKTYLRRTLWELQNDLDARSWLSGSPLLNIESDWIRLEIPPSVSFDLSLFEQAYGSVKGTSADSLKPEQVVQLEEAVELYTGDLLENWYQRWCLTERNRTKRMYLLMLDKLLGHSCAHRWYEKGLEYGERILRVDRAREQTHRQLMHLRYVAGDRTGALRQYQQCAEALEKELHVGPSAKTQQLYDQIRNGQDAVRSPTTSPTKAANATLEKRLQRIQHIRRTLGALHDQIQQEIDVFDMLLNKKSRPPTA